jgi:hypothetical protein
MDTGSDERGLTVSERICGERHCIQVPYTPSQQTTHIRTTQGEKYRVGDIITIRRGDIVEKALVTYAGDYGITVVRNYGS